MNEIWNIIEPYILTLVGTLGGGSIIAALASIVCRRIVAKASTAYDLDKLAEKVADKLGGKTINIDITTVVNKQLAKIAEKLADEVKNVADETNSYKRILALIGEAVSQLKILTEEERKQLIDAAKELDSEYVPPEKDVVSTIKLEPIETQTLPAESSDSAVNLG